MVNLDWLPDRHLEAVATLAHVDETVEAISLLAQDCQTNRADVLRLEERVRDGQNHLVVSSVLPIPPKVSRLTADALLDLRSVLEHVVFAEVQHSLGRTLSEQEARRISVPVHVEEQKFTEWSRGKRKQGYKVLGPGAYLSRRIYQLQPFHRGLQADRHPLKMLAALTNPAKHRAPVVLAVGVPTLIRHDLPVADSRIDRRGGCRPVEPGEVLLSTAIGQVVPLDLFPTLLINVPGADAWLPLANLLRDLVDWVRKVAVPMLVTGTAPQTPQIPARYEITESVTNMREAIARGTQTTADTAGRRRLGGMIARRDLADLLAAMPDAPSLASALAWLESLSDAEVLQKTEELRPSADRDPAVVAANYAALELMRDEALAFARDARTDA